MPQMRNKRYPCDEIDCDKNFNTIKELASHKKCHKKKDRVSKIYASNAKEINGEGKSKENRSNRRSRKNERKDTGHASNSKKVGKKKYSALKMRAQKPVQDEKTLNK
ncbi:hypothetical protein RclHR1_10450003 [Rhizophagus clarus]|uniref:C2H2-type domain-containing protein n=1 Tax=Rhizophagus clarus TaxID=94130 RepID=A0A2Z6Q1L5_9GLOM|nr:hypothetical protein RclHR1_10450003 [Rhizophagus clarus]GES91659.1 hypothetical protein RCL_jg13904.t1 [Rhizophagus clarus]